MVDMEIVGVMVANAFDVERCRHEPAGGQVGKLCADLLLFFQRGTSFARSVRLLSRRAVVSRPAIGRSCGGSAIVGAIGSGVGGL